MRLLRQLATRSGARGAPDPAVVDRLLRRALIERDANGALTLTASGRHVVRRALAETGGFALQHQTRSTISIDDGRGRRSVTINRDESPRARLRRQKGGDGRPLIDAPGFAAGERLRADFTRGQIMPRVSANWTAAVTGGGRGGGAGGMAELTDAVIAARQRVDRALSAVGPEFSGILVAVCCFLKGVEEIERARGWPARSAKLVLRLALAALARHYGLSEKATGSGRAGRLEHWGAEDYRPVIE